MLKYRLCAKHVYTCWHYWVHMHNESGTARYMHAQTCTKFRLEKIICNVFQDSSDSQLCKHLVEHTAARLE